MAYSIYLVSGKVTKQNQFRKLGEPKTKWHDGGNMEHHPELTTTIMADCVKRWQHGEQQAANQLLQLADRRMRRLTHKMLGVYPHVHRWEETGDVLNNAMLRLINSLQKASPKTTRDFFNLVAVQIRRELIDLARHYYGPRGHGTRFSSASEAHQKHILESKQAPTESTSSTVEMWLAMNKYAESLSGIDREVFDMTVYGGLKQREIAEILDRDVRTVKEYWRRVKLLLSEMMFDSTT